MWNIKRGIKQMAHSVAAAPPVSRFVDVDSLQRSQELWWISDIQGRLRWYGIPECWSASLLMVVIQADNKVIPVRAFWYSSISAIVLDA